MGTFRLYVRFTDGEIWHGVYDSVTDTAARFLAPTADDVAGWAMEGDYREDGDLDGLGDPVDIATDYDDFHWYGTALRLPEPGRWCWLTGPVSCDDKTTIQGRPDWLVEHLAQPEYPPARAWPRQSGVYPWPMSDGKHILTTCPHYAPPPRPVVGRSAFTECRRIDATWVHAKPHAGCPNWTRGR